MAAFRTFQKNLDEAVADRIYRNRNQAGPLVDRSGRNSCMSSPRSRLFGISDNICSSLKNDITVGGQDWQPLPDQRFNVNASPMAEG